MAIAVSRMNRAAISAGRCPAGSGRVSLESARREEPDGVGFGESAWL